MHNIKGYVRAILPYLLLAACGALKAADRIEFDPSSDSLLLELHFEGRTVANRAAFEAVESGNSYKTPAAMRIFGDGRIIIHRYAADEFRELVIPDFELRELLQQLLGAGIHQLDAEDLSAALEATDRMRYEVSGKVRLTADLPTWRLTFRLESYAPEDGDAGPVSLHSSWRSLFDSARDDDSDSEVIQRFTSIESLLTDLFRRVEQDGATSQGE